MAGVSTNLVALITDDELDLRVSEPEFTSLAGTILSNAATEDDGFPTLAAEAMMGAGNFFAGSESLVPHIAAAEVAGAVTTQDTLAAQTQQLAVDLANGQKLLIEAGVETGTQPPSPTPTPPPVQPRDLGLDERVRALLPRPIEVD